LTTTIEQYIQTNAKVLDSKPIKPKVAAPFVKWAGGKRSIIGELVKRLPPTIGDYYEPFMGGAALYFELQQCLQRQTFLSDINWDLVITFQVVKKSPKELIAKLEEHAKKDSVEYFYEVRRQQELDNAVDVAARFIYLNKTCYNGLYRVNKKGEFNVPRGQLGPSSYVVQKENILASSKALQKATIQEHEFDKISPKSGDFVYLDPPYHPSDSTSFTKYTKLDFSEKDQIRLRDFATELTKNKVNVMLSNSDTKYVLNLYDAEIWHIDKIRAPRFVNCKANGRGAVNELVITNYPISDIVKKTEAEDQ
jgi:DNA adenine methylase